MTHPDLYLPSDFYNRIQACDIDRLEGLLPAHLVCLVRALPLLPNVRPVVIFGDKRGAYTIFGPIGGSHFDAAIHPQPWNFSLMGF